MGGNLLQEVAAYLEAGGWVMPPLVAATLILWFAIGYRFAALKRGSERDVRNLIRRYEKGKVPRRDGVLVRALKKGIELRDRRPGELRPYLDDAFFEEQKEIRRYSRLIITIVTAAPLLGLLGTVIGMIEVFNVISLQGSGDIELLAAGISKALVTTAGGLTVAIPSLLFYRYFRGRVDELVLRMEEEALLLVDIIGRVAGGERP
jgi:biopolymer transport protein ExbB